MLKVSLHAFILLHVLYHVLYCIVLHLALKYVTAKISEKIQEHFTHTPSTIYWEDSQRENDGTSLFKNQKWASQIAVRA